MPALLEAIGRVDVAAFQWLRTHHWPLVDPIMAGLSDIARGGAIWIALSLLIAVLHPSRWAAATQVVLAVVLTGQLCDHVAKPLFNRSRPFESDIETQVYGYKPTTRSMPSGHAAQAVAAAYTLSRLAPDARIVFWCLAAMVGLSRIYLGVHYPADVVVGVLFGGAVAAFVVGGTTWRFADRPATGAVGRSRVR